ncbi:MAG: DUF1553 domain-containing protein [Acidobacteria bacterium]|nr:DUF1553 domain-containing protein [Acidobacteriota bacterium]
MRPLASFATVLLAAPGLAAAEPATSAIEILQRRCVSCHSTKVKMANLDLTRRETAIRGGIRGAAIKPADLAGSVLWQRIEKGQMPPSAPLPAEERRALREWIEAGAPWSAPIVEKRAGPEWWSLQPLVKSTAPPAPERWARSPIDRWVHAGLEKAGLQPSPRADRRTLIRRLSIDLLGLPPDPAAVDAFVADSRADAYERLVDRMLASPHYGERWARHWLDLARYAESEGFERDQLRENVWKYRDYVIRSLNADKPYAQFAREQIAGDVLEKTTHESMLATALLTMGPTDAIGLTSAVDSEREAVREDMLEEMLGVVGQTFLGLTVNCARCHDHKFDPIPQREYYRMRSALSSVWPAIGHSPDTIDPNPSSLPLLTPEERRSREEKVQPIEAQIAEWERTIAEAYRTVRPAPDPTAPRPYARWTFDVDARNDAAGLHGVLPANARIEGGVLAPGEKAETVTLTTSTLEKEIREKTLEAWIRVKKQPSKAVAVFELRNRSGFRGASVDGLQYAAGKNRQWENTSIGRFRTAGVNGAPEDTAEGGLLHLAIVYRADDRIQIYRNGNPYGAAYLPEQGTASSKLQTYFPGDAVARFTANVELHVEEARLYDRALTAAEMAASYSQGVSNYPADVLRARMNDSQREALESAEQGLRQQRKLLAAIPVPEPAWIAAVRPAAPTHVLGRGDVTKKGEVVPPGGISAVKGVAAEFGLAPGASDTDKRRKLADWITAENNPLFWRVAVNRVWHHHFGTGLVENPNDFGYNGGQPSHPELLDWLATEFRAGGGQLKALHKTILLSEAYQQSSALNAEAAKKDAENRLLWRFTPRRVQGEVVRDSILSVSGQLNPQMFGKGFQPFKIADTTGSYRVYHLNESSEPEQLRRTIYRMNAITAGSPMLEALDCPLPGVKMPKRAATTTALQALSLMNNGFMNQQAKAFAARLRHETAAVEAQINRAFTLTLGRKPQGWEIDASAALVKESGSETLCWGLLNTSEFLYVE